MPESNSEPATLPLSGDALEPYRVAHDGNCWWCGNKADSREHKYKRTDLTRMWQDGQYLNRIGPDDRIEDIRSAKRSKNVRFKPSLCAACNNSRSQPFDRAWDVFADHVWRSSDQLAAQDFLDLKVLYGDAWKESAANLARYVVKHIGCRMIDDGYSPPATFNSFLDGLPVCEELHMCTFFNHALHAEEVERRAESINARGLWIAPAHGAVSPSRQALTAYGSSLTIASVGIMYRWEAKAELVDPFYVYSQARLHNRSSLPEW